MSRLSDIVFFVLILSIGIITILFSFIEINKDSRKLDVVLPPIDYLWPSPSPSSPGYPAQNVNIPEKVHVEDQNYTAEKGNQPSDGNPTYLMALKCPADYGVTNVSCKSNVVGRSDIKLLGVSRNTEGPLCVFEAAKSFIGTISADCEKSLGSIPIYKAAEFSPGEFSKLPPYFEIWGTQKMQNVSGSEYEVQLTCPRGYSGSDVMCLLDTPINYGGVELMDNAVENKDGVETGFCRYTSGNSYDVTIRIHCSQVN